MQSQKTAFLFLCSFLVMGMIFNSSVVFADEGSNSGSSDSAAVTTASGDDGSENVETTSDDETKTDRERLKEVAKERLERRGERLKENLKTEFRENGAVVKVERKVEVQADGSVKIEIKRTIIDANGVERKIVIKIIEKDGERRIKIKDESKNKTGDENDEEDENEIETELEVDDDFEGNQSDLEATTSDGKKHKLKVLPDEARQIIMERLKALNITNITLEEIKHKNIPGVVYQIETNKHGKFLGVFKLAMKIDSQVDPTTGEVFDVSKPWWAILVNEQDENVPAAASESSASTETTDTSA